MRRSDAILKTLCLIAWPGNWLCVQTRVGNRWLPNQICPNEGLEG